MERGPVGGRKKEVRGWKRSRGRRGKRVREDKLESLSKQSALK